MYLTLPPRKKYDKETLSHKKHEQMKKSNCLEFHPIVTNSEVRVDMVELAMVHAGFPSPVDDAYMNQPIALNTELITHPATSFLVRVTGDSMIEESIDSGDILIVDRSLMPTERQICICCINGEFAVKRIR